MHKQCCIKIYGKMGVIFLVSGSIDLKKYKGQGLLLINPSNVLSDLQTTGVNGLRCKQWRQKSAKGQVFFVGLIGVFI